MVVQVLVLDDVVVCIVAPLSHCTLYGLHLDFLLRPTFGRKNHRSFILQNFFKKRKLTLYELSKLEQSFVTTLHVYNAHQFELIAPAYSSAGCDQRSSVCYP